MKLQAKFPGYIADRYQEIIDEVVNTSRKTNTTDLPIMVGHNFIIPSPSLIDPETYQKAQQIENQYKQYETYLESLPPSEANKVSRLNNMVAILRGRGVPEDKLLQLVKDAKGDPNQVIDLYVKNKEYYHQPSGNTDFRISSLGVPETQTDRVLGGSNQGVGQVNLSNIFKVLEVASTPSVPPTRPEQLREKAQNKGAMNESSFVQTKSDRQIYEQYKRAAGYPTRRDIEEAARIEARWKGVSPAAVDQYIKNRIQEYEDLLKRANPRLYNEYLSASSFEDDLARSGLTYEKLVENETLMRIADAYNIQEAVAKVQKAKASQATGVNNFQGMTNPQISAALLQQQIQAAQNANILPQRVGQIYDPVLGKYRDATWADNLQTQAHWRMTSPQYRNAYFQAQREAADRAQNFLKTMALQSSKIAQAPVETVQNLLPSIQFGAALASDAYKQSTAAQQQYNQMYRAIIRQMLANEYSNAKEESEKDSVLRKADAFGISSEELLGAVKNVSTKAKKETGQEE